MGPSNLDDAEGEDLELHMELSATGRLDAILESRDLTHEQALESMNAMHAENQATFPHLIETSVMGQFRNRRPAGHRGEALHRTVRESASARGVGLAICEDRSGELAGHHDHYA